MNLKLSQKATFKSEIFELGFYANLTQHDKLPIFLQKSLHPSAHLGPLPLSLHGAYIGA